MPIQRRFREVVHSPELDEVLKRGTRRAAEEAGKTLLAAKKAMGFASAQTC